MPLAITEIAVVVARRRPLQRLDRPVVDVGIDPRGAIDRERLGERVVAAIVRADDAVGGGQREVEARQQREREYDPEAPREEAKRKGDVVDGLYRSADETYMVSNMGR
jgi:hypothetical protein